ncbi:DUF167 domain-containing protein [Brevundimonas sp. SORGH_AS_0993]|uniref:DUF167 domain-containing protein n=1 Tax=Brevundimonas sp. SORGH_AS_0993 TaxID=3041794 RepID=UPI00277D35E5|nr:DUF167 domain-containing protein [Brevundimonas sp. SORGH_AS_0993]MDQ1154970.1 uncharacterized protein (TIGR00251 family) [Brevundimonas sp. SORGH_AS_0993]
MAQLPIKLQPGAAADRIDGWDVDPDGRRVLKVRVRARPVDGEANVALIKFLAKTLGTPKSSVALTRGGQSRLKMIVVEGLDEAALEARLSGVTRPD